MHILLAFPTPICRFKPEGQFNNNPNVTAEVQLMMDPNADPYAASDDAAEVEKFGASDVMDLKSNTTFKRLHLYRMWTLYQ